MMRIIAGKFKGRRIDTVKSLKVRPMLDQIREALFSILGSFVREAKVIDCFAGSGGVGLEALSRGAKHVSFFELDKSVANILRSNIKKCGITTEAIVITGPLPSTLKVIKTNIDLVFLDPPFGNPIGIKTLKSVASSTWLTKDSIIIYRSPKEELVLEAYPPLHRFDQRIYGRSTLSFFRKVE